MITDKNYLEVKDCSFWNSRTMICKSWERIDQKNDTDPWFFKQYPLFITSKKCFKIPNMSQNVIQMRSIGYAVFPIIPRLKITSEKNLQCSQYKMLGISTTTLMVTGRCITNCSKNWKNRTIITKVSHDLNVSRLL